MQQNKYYAPLDNRSIYPIYPPSKESQTIIEIFGLETIAAHEKEQGHDKNANKMIKPYRTSTMLQYH